MTGEENWHSSLQGIVIKEIGTNAAQKKNLEEGPAEGGKILDDINWKKK